MTYILLESVLRNFVQTFRPIKTHFLRGIHKPREQRRGYEGHRGLWMPFILFLINRMGTSNRYLILAYVQIKIRKVLHRFVSQPSLHLFSDAKIQHSKQMPTLVSICKFARKKNKKNTFLNAL